jgi:two-component system CheB/CheR fusion protein
MGVHEVASLPAYARFLRDHREEARALFNDLLISVTNFFRDPDAFAALEQKVVPRLFERKAAGDSVRVWVAGCATGEEAYSIAMRLSEHADTLPFAPPVQVFATDLDEKAIAHARAGYYTLNDVADVPPERLRTFFTKDGEGFRIRRELRELVLFAHHNLIKDPPFSHLDLVSCRNLLIYLNRSAQERALQVLHFALNPRGFLFLGSSESADGGGTFFAPFDKEHHIFQSREVAPRVKVSAGEFSPSLRMDLSSQTPDRTKGQSTARESAQGRLPILERHRILLELYGPPSLVVDDALNVVHVSANAARYLRFGAGVPSTNVLEVVRPELRLELRTALLQAAQTRTSVEARGLVLEGDDGHDRINLVVRPAPRDSDDVEGLFLVLFETARDEGLPDAADARAPVSAVEPAARRLEEENVALRVQLRSTVEQYETQAEEFKAANEELQAINEELRSTTEELETSKEELQSVNEELSTVNQELKIKIEELSQANNDMRNLMSSTEIGTVFLDRELRVKLFTPRAKGLFNLIPSDVGRPLADIRGKLVDERLLDQAESVIERLQSVEREVETRDGRVCASSSLRPARKASSISFRRTSADRSPTSAASSSTSGCSTRRRASSSASNRLSAKSRRATGAYT